MTVLHVHARDIARHDAVGSFARQVGALASGAGWTVRYWAGHADAFPDAPVSPRDDLAASAKPDDVIFQNFSIYDPIFEQIAALPNRKLVYFHNITPPELIDPADPATVENCAAGLAQRHLCAGFDEILANSNASADVLRDGLLPPDREQWRDRIVICPPVIGLDRWTGISEEPVQLEPGRRRLLFVGRLVPNKGVRELLDLFAEAARLLPDLALDIVGNPPHGAYADALRIRAAEISAQTGAPVTVRHGIPDGALKTLYRAATACITLTRHEGFCVPAADALAFGRPFFHTPIPAVAEVVGDAGFTLPFDDPGAGAAALAAALNDTAALNAAAAAGRRQSQHLREAADGSIIRDALSRVEQRV